MENYNPEGSALRRDQKELFRMLQIVAGICKEHDIQWWLSSGTLLGAARHKGFIPWDDDMDIVLLKEGYDKLEKILCEMQSDEFVYHCMKTDVEYVNSFGKFRKREGRIQSASPRYNYYKWAGIGLDIFAIEKTSYLAARLAKILYSSQHITKRIKTDFVRKPLIRFIEFVNFKVLFPIVRLIGKINPREEYHYTLGTGWPRHTFYMKDTFPLTETEFEGVMMPVPKDMDAYLTNVYGDWRKQPSYQQILKAIHCQEYKDEIMKNAEISIDVSKYNQEGSPMRNNQKLLTSILDDLAAICEKNDIEWWLSSGTLLGAARHKGFIPWDDDIDIVMMRKDFKKLKKILLAQEDEKYFLQCMESDIEYVNTYMKFRKKGLTLNTFNPRTRYFKHKGPFVDIFCLEYSNYPCAYLAKFIYYGLQHPTIYVKNKYIRRALIVLVEFISLSVLIPIIRIFGKINPKHEYHYELGSGWPKHTFYKRDMYPLSKAEFEGKLYPVPANMDAYLTNVYHDWRTLPSEDIIRKSFHSYEYVKEIFGE